MSMEQLFRILSVFVTAVCMCFTGDALASQQKEAVESELPAIAFVARLVGDENRARFKDLMNALERG